MNSAFVLSAYFAMVFSPCFVAQWGDLLTYKWVFALATRRRTHRAEGLLTSFRQVRYAMAVAAEAAFAARGMDEAFAPAPFVVLKYSMPVDSPAFLEAKQRVATKLAQLAVAQKLRHEAEMEAAAEAAKAAGMPVPAREMRVPVPAAVSQSGTHIRPRRPDVGVYEPVYREPAREPMFVPMPALAFAGGGYVPADAVFRDETPPERAPASRGIHLVSPESSGAVEVAA